MGNRSQCKLWHEGVDTEGNMCRLSRSCDCGMEDLSYMQNDEGVHIMDGEFTLCGDAFDIGATEDDVSSLSPIAPTVITCKRCVRIIKKCRDPRIQV